MCSATHLFRTWSAAKFVCTLSVRPACVPGGWSSCSTTKESGRSSPTGGLLRRFRRRNRRTWFRGARALHAPAYCLFGEPLASATRYAVELAKADGALLSIDLASASFIVAHGSHHVRDEVAALEPEVLVGTAAEARALLGHSRVAELTSIAPIVVVKEGARVRRCCDGRIRSSPSTYRRHSSW